MQIKGSVAVAVMAMIAPAVARDVPSGLKAFYDTAKKGTCAGADLLKGGFYDQEGGDKSFGYCKKGMGSKGFFLKGNNQLANMDIDCDGHQTKGDGRCGGSSDTQSETTWKDEASKFGIPDLNAQIHPYVVLGNEGSYNPTFDPQKAGVQPLSLVAVVCGEKLVYGVWGDTNGDDGPPLVGEASIALATECFGKGMNADSGHDEADVLYIAFSGDAAVPGSSADWKASNFQDFEASIATLGDKLVTDLIGGGSTENATVTKLRKTRTFRA